MNEEEGDHTDADQGRQRPGPEALLSRSADEALASHARRLSTLEAAIIEQEHRAVKILGNAVSALSLEKGDPKRTAAFKAVAWRWLAPAAIATSGVGFGAIVAILSYLELSEQNDTLREELALQRKALELGDQDRALLLEDRRRLEAERKQQDEERRLRCVENRRCIIEGLCVPYGTSECVASEESCRESFYCRAAGACHPWTPADVDLGGFGTACAPREQTDCSTLDIPPMLSAEGTFTRCRNGPPICTISGRPGCKNRGPLMEDLPEHLQFWKSATSSE